MRSHIEYIEPTKAKATIEADASDLAMAKQSAITSLAHNIKVPGFRQGKAPASVSEKYVDNQQLAEEALQVALNDLYQKTLVNSKIRPVSQPQIEVKRYVPNESLEFEAVVEVVGKIKLGPYKGLKIKRE
ncbi:trigger factor family protein, partial [Patescibacteria group bacterium]|nr:trigger factor family protein [Patescibacteria group bacterium]